MDVVITAEQPKEAQMPQVIEFKVRGVVAGPLKGEEERSKQGRDGGKAVSPRSAKWKMTAQNAKATKACLPFVLHD